MLPLLNGLAPARKHQRPAPPLAGSLPALKEPRLLDQLRERIRYLHYSRRSEDAYVFWCRAFIRWLGLRHPAEMGGGAVRSPLDLLPSTAPPQSRRW